MVDWHDFKKVFPKKSNSDDFSEIHVEATIPCLCCCFVLLRVCIVLLHVVDIIVVISGIVKDLNNTYLVYRN